MTLTYSTISEMILKPMILFIFLFLFSCRENRQLEYAMQLAGNNRKELEQVIDHYKLIGDKQKLRAAEYLIVNMPFHSYMEPDLDNFNHHLFDMMKMYGISQSQALDSLRKIYSITFTYNNDTEKIQSKFLINNIDWAFKVWKESPWGKNLSFDLFCKEILPYRVGSEPLEEWREHYYNQFKPVLDSLLNDDSPLSACQILYDTLIKKSWKYTSKSFANLGAKVLLENDEGGHCATQTQLMTFVMRSVGIPGGIDCYLCAPDKMGGGHSWNYFRNTTGEVIDFNFEPCDAGYIRDTTGNIIGHHFEQDHIKRMSVTRKKGKVYRESFEIKNKYFPLEISELPLTIQRSRRLRDVSFEYFDKNDITLKLEKNDQKIIYLCVFNDKEWVAVDFMEIKNGKVRLNAIEKNVVFLLGYCIDHQIVTEGNPFVYDGEKLNYFIADTTNLEKITLTRKYSMSIGMERISKYIVGGQFQVAGNVEFKDAETIHTITEDADMMYHTIDLNIEKEYRFIRYLSADNGFCCMAEMEFFSQEHELLKGKVIGTEGTRWGNEAHTKYAVFDKDPLTYFVSVEPSGAWVGMDFGRPEKIGKIRYLFRNDDNSIRPGDLYELFYFSPEGWVSCGIKQGQGASLIYDKVPGNALFWLRNHTRGREERIFSYGNDRQIFW